MRSSGLMQPRGRVSPRPADESHRVATPLELFFDLCFVVAVAQAGRELAAALGHGQFSHGLGSYAVVFFSIWWPWMNYTWFASGFDPGDIPIKLATFVQITGELVIAAGVPKAFESRDYAIVVVGYVVVRLAFASQWIRVYRDNPGLRPAALRWGGGVIAVQAGWVLLQFAAHGHAFEIGFGVLVAVEFAIPYWSSRSGRNPFHRHHIAERYGSFTLIVLGETVSAATVAIQESTAVHEDLRELLSLALGGLLIVFVAWWVYFAHEIGELLLSASAFLWGYGHYFVFASAASIGAGIEVGAQWTTGQEPISAQAAAASVTVPASVFFITVWALQARHFVNGWARALLPATSAAVLLCTLAGGYAVILAGSCCALAVVLGEIPRRSGHVERGPSTA